MVVTLARLQLTLAWRGLRSSTGRTVATVLLGLYGLGVLTAAVAGLVVLRDPGFDALRGPLLTVGFALLTLGWPVVGVLSGGDGELLEPGRFALFPVSARALLPGLLVAGLLSPGALSTAVLGLAGVVSWSGSAPAATAALFAAVMGTLTCFLLARVLGTALSRLLNARRFRDTGVVAVFLVLLAASALGQLVSRRLDPGALLGGGLDGPARVVSWTPVGWVWALPWDLARGQWLAFAVHLVGATALCAVLLRVWSGQLAEGLVSPVGGTGQGGRAGRSRIDALLPRGPVGAVAARELRYWRRDPRRLVQLLSVAVVPVFIVMPVVLNGAGEATGPVMVAFAPVVGAIMLGSPSAWALSYDGSALWMQVLAGGSGREDRLGRSLALALIALPVLLVIAVVTTGWTGRWSLLPGVLGATLGGVSCALGAGSWVGSVWQQAMPPPGGNAFARGAGGGAENILGSFVAVVLPAVLTAPAVALALLAVWHPEFGWAGLLWGPGSGALVLWAGVTLGGRRLDRHWPEVLVRVREISV